MSKYWFKFSVFDWNSSFVADCDDSAYLFLLPRIPPPSTKKNQTSQTKKNKRHIWVLGVYIYIYTDLNFETFEVCFFWFYGRSAVFSFPLPLSSPPWRKVTLHLWCRWIRHHNSVAWYKKGEMFGQRLTDSHILYIYTVCIYVNNVHIYTHVSGPCKGCQIDGKGCHWATP